MEDSDVFEKNILNEFSHKQNQTFESFKKNFEFLSDNSVIISKKQKPESGSFINQILDTIEKEKNKSQDLSACDDRKLVLDEQNSDDKNELETISLENEKSKLNGFWHRKDNIRLETKFNNFVPDDKEDLTNQQNIELNLDEFKSINCYIPTVQKKEEHSSSNSESKEDTEIIPVPIIEENHIKLSKRKAETEEYLNESRPFPGEFDTSIDDDYVIITKNNITMLEFYDSIINDQENCVDSDPNNDLVEEFQLDSNHNYDAYLNKPKYNF